jgi:hypothetical protein
MERAPRMAGFKGKVFRPLLGWFVVTVVLLGWRNHQTQERQSTIQFAVSLEGRAGRPHYQARLNHIPFDSGSYSGLGRKRLTIEANNAETFVTNVFVGYGGVGLGHIRLARRRGTLVLKTKPAAVRVIINGAETNCDFTGTPSGILSLPTGFYTSKVEFARFTLERRFYVAAREADRLVIDADVTTFALSSNPTNAQFELRSLSHTNVTVQSNTPVTITELPAGNYHLRIWRGDYQKTVPIKLSADGTNELQVEFDYAKITIQSEPAGANIRDGKKLLGTTPVSLTLPTGLYQLTVAKEGFVTTNVALSLLANEDRTFELSLLSEVYVSALERARNFSSGFFVDLDRALEGVNTALQAKPGDEPATTLKQEIVYQRHLRDAREFRRSRQITRAFEEVESALKLKVNGPDALTLKQDLQKEQQAVAAAEAQAKRDLPRKAFEDAVQRLPHHDLFPSHESKLAGQAKAVRDKILEALARTPSWSVARLDKPDENVSVIHADIKGFGSRQNAIIVVSQASENEVAVHWKLWTFTLGNNIQIGLSGISDSSFKPLHTSYATPLGAASVERRRQTEIEQFKKRLELP